MAVFIDTNIFIYAQEGHNANKSGRARDILKTLIKNGEAKISTQVIREFCNIALRKSEEPLKKSELDAILDQLLIQLLAHKPDGDFFKRAINTYNRYSLSFYDALIVQAAMDLECDTLYSEDMQNGASYGDVKVINPFA